MPALPVGQDLAQPRWNFLPASDTLAPHPEAPDGVEMQLTNVDPSLYNRDLAPIPQEQRSWGTYNYASLWVAMSVCIPTYMLASGLIAGGMNWFQAVGTILLGNLIVLIPMLLNAHAGTRYGIPFPVFVRASFGVRCATFPPLPPPSSALCLLRLSSSSL